VAAACQRCFFELIERPTAPDQPELGCQVRAKILRRVLAARGRVAAEPGAQDQLLIRGLTRGSAVTDALSRSTEYATASRFPRPIAIAGCMLLAPLAVALSLWRGHDPVEHAASLPLIHREDGFAGSQACASCHVDQHASWARTFHSTMTQRASPHSVVGAFDGRVVAYEGQEARPFERDGKFFMDLPGKTGRRTEVVHRRLAALPAALSATRGEDFAFLRLPILWHIEAKRWLHLNTVFLGPDDANWDSHAAEWNENCIFCHTTAPQPRMTNYALPSRREQERFDSEVADLGIACEACHGPGAAHAAAQRDPLRRYAESFSSAPIDDIVHPRKLDQERSVAVCGQTPCGFSVETVS
jgi:hypothetical protein